MTCILCGAAATSWTCNACHKRLLAAICRELIDAAIYERQENDRRGAA